MKAGGTTIYRITIATILLSLLISFGVLILFLDKAQIGATLLDNVCLVQAHKCQVRLNHALDTRLSPVVYGVLIISTITSLVLSILQWLSWRSSALIVDEEKPQGSNKYTTDELILPGITWQKEVKPSPNWTSASYPLRPATLPMIQHIPSLQEVKPSPNRTSTPCTPHPITLPIVQHTPSLREPGPDHFSPRTIFWVSMIVALVLVGAFGVIGAVGHQSTFSKPYESLSLQVTPQEATTGTDGSGHQSTFSEPHGSLSLQVTPQEATIGTTVSLRGENFSPLRAVKLTRDAPIPILDTSGISIVQSDIQGNFTDTVQVQAGWGSGSHTINAEDTLTHKIASFPIMVSSDAVTARPSHLHLSVDSLNLGSGDQTTNSKQTISLTNLGNGQISWQGSTTQSWLMITPQSGTFYSGTQSKVIVAVDRTNLHPGSYKDQVLFTSNAGSAPLDVSMQVTPNEAVLQLTPPVLSFVRTNGSITPTPRVVTLSNPGTRPLKWIALSSDPWLLLSVHAGTIQPANSTHIIVSVDTSTLSSGTHSSSITFSSPGPDAITHSSQGIDITTTIE